ncbi:hypothetical protein [Methylorubrum thiocyanatum]|uniref:Uncharacterized protein n=1 Tax=Methylorubrum thiocyanatum TaxID=47958 RepID=A0AA40S3X5_9HYPH|nr:hypothetical protein [Methylorubrum thiocyanatum]MBA8914106.1 hypothetical protein [Methylorubrum thiocyanatum]GJE79071.1 hypothetical protein CJNNKLLH_0396 [Methylorubrum thiocyanatum]
MGKSTRETLYPGTRLSAKTDPRGVAVTDGHPGQPDYALIEALRAAREQGYDAITAIERYDPDFSVDLSRCRDEAEADWLLERWHARRSAVLDETRTTLKRIWADSRRASKAD